MATEWQFEQESGGGWLYDEAGMSYDENEWETFPVYYNSLGSETSWSYESKP